MTAREFEPQAEPWWIDAPVMQDRRLNLQLDDDHQGGPTCKGPGPTRQEFVNGAGNRDVRTTAPCPRCDGQGGSHGGYTLVTLEQQGLAS